MQNNNSKSKRPYVRSLDGFVVNGAPKKTVKKKINLEQLQTKKNLTKQEDKIKPIVKPVVLPKKEIKPDEVIVLDNSKTRKPKTNSRKILKRSLLGALALILIISGYLGFRFFRSIDKVFHGNIISDTQAFFSTTPLKGESNGRVNILLAGDSADDSGHQGGNLTDSIVVLSVDTKNRTAFMLSVPRDLWVNIKGVGWQKINAANAIGLNIPGYPANGMGRLEYIVSQNLGIPINYYALANYSAFRDAVNAVGGITVNIQSPDPRGLYDPSIDWSTRGPMVKLSNGIHNLNGQQALNLARARGDAYGAYGFPSSDFDRTAHQRLLFSAIAQKALSLGVISNPVKVGNLFDSFSKNVQTDMTLQNILRFISITKGFDLNKVKSYSYCSTMNSASCGVPIITTYQDPATGMSALVPIKGVSDYSQLVDYYTRLTSNNPVFQESPTVVILNGSNTIGLAKTEEANLTRQGYNVLLKSDATKTYTTSLIVDNSKGAKPNSLKYLENTFSANSVTSTKGNPEALEASGYNADFIVVLGQNVKAATN
jgi:LCP family protein required for cell wall assembly